jgi:hypothetical protein
VDEYRAHASIRGFRLIADERRRKSFRMRRVERLHKALQELFSWFPLAGSSLLRPREIFDHGKQLPSRT